MGSWLAGFDGRVNSDRPGQFPISHRIMLLSPFCGAMNSGSSGIPLAQARPALPKASHGNIPFHLCRPSDGFRVVFLIALDGTEHFCSKTVKARSRERSRPFTGNTLPTLIDTAGGQARIRLIEFFTAAWSLSGESANGVGPAECSRHRGDDYPFGGLHMCGCPKKKPPVTGRLWILNKAFLYALLCRALIS